MVTTATTTTTASVSVAVLLLAVLPTLAVSLATPTRNADGGVDRQPNFDAQSYLGKWYEIARRKNTPFELGTDNLVNYALNANGTIAVSNVEWRATYWYEVTGVATIVDNARLLVDFFMGPPGDYQVLKTDYNTYAVVYSYAGKVGSRKLELGWVLSRQSTLSQQLLDEAYQLFESRTDLKRSDFELTQHGVAPYPVKRRYSLYEEVPLQPDFDLASYTGLWYEIYRTKNTPFQSGTDITALYEPKVDAYTSASAGTNARSSPGTLVSVTNTEWLTDKQKWSVIQGVATYVSNARLLVSFDPSQPGGDYRVLYTDYNNVAVVYSEFTAGPIVVKYSWILSRQASLTAELEAKAFQVLQQAAGLSRDQFGKTQHGVAPKQ